MEQCGLALAHKSLCLYLFVSDWHLPFCPSLLLPTFSCFSSFSSKIIMFVSLSIQVFLPRALSLFFPSFHSFYFSLSIREVTHLSPWKFLRQLVKKREILCQARCCVVEGKLAKENPPLCKFYVELPIWSTFGLSVKDGTWKDLREVARRERFKRLKHFLWKQILQTLIIYSHVPFSCFSETLFYVEWLQCHCSYIYDVTEVLIIDADPVECCCAGFVLFTSYTTLIVVEMLNSMFSARYRTGSCSRFFKQIISVSHQLNLGWLTP